MTETPVDSSSSPVLPPKEIFEVGHIDGLYIRPAQPYEDHKLVELSAETLCSNGLVQTFERYHSYFKASQVLSKQPAVMVITATEQPQKILAMFTVARRDCFINGRIQSLCYLADLHFSKALTQKQDCIALMMSYLKRCYRPDEIFQTLSAPHAALVRNKYYKSYADLPGHYVADYMETYTLTGFKVPRKLSSKLAMSIMTQDDIEAVERFMLHMADYYNFLPVYNFKELLAKDAYWADLSLNDFYIIRRSGQIVALFGLWNQKTFKQTCIAPYSALIAALRPAYNYWAKISHQLRLPQQGNTLNYMSLHSLLCNPYDTDLFENALRMAYQAAVDKKCYVLRFTLAENDPRCDCARVMNSQKTQSIHAFHSFKDEMFHQFDDRRISYVEYGRI